MFEHRRFKAPKESGQVLILVILGIVVIFGFVALAVDGGTLFEARRSAQNAADAAALSAAYAMCDGLNTSGIQAAATTIASSNGFTDNGDDVLVDVTVGVPGYSKPSEYVEVVITTVQQPIFVQFVYKEPLESTVRAVSHCAVGSGAGTSVPGVGGEMAIVALNKTASGAVKNTGGAQVIVDGGVFINSTANDALDQNGSAKLLMSWAKIRGGAKLGGAFGVYSAGTGSIAKQIDVVKDFQTSGAGQAIAGAFNIGGNVINTASINMTGNPMNVGGNFQNSGAATINASPLLIGGYLENTAGGVMTSENVIVGDYVKQNGNGQIQAPSGKTLNMIIKGNVDLSGSAKINGNVTMQGTYTHSGTGAITGTITNTTVTKPVFSVTIPEMDDPLATLVNPPTMPTGSCTNLSVPNWGTNNPTMVSGAYYCKLDFGGSVVSTIPPGTYWTDSFSLSGAAKLKMDGVHLYITGKGATTAFQMAGSTQISMIGTMIYIKSGAFAISGASGTFNWSAPGTGDYPGMALYMDRSNAYSASQTGSTVVASQSGTWYAPKSNCSFTGDTSTTIYSQFICDTVTVTGSSQLKIKYDGTKVFQVPTSGGGPQVSLEQ